MSNLNTLIARMIEYEDGCVERVNHFLKVFAFAKTIAEGEGLDRETQELDAAAQVHTQTLFTAGLCLALSAAALVALLAWFDRHEE